MAVSPADARREQLLGLDRLPFTDQLAEWLEAWRSALSGADAPKQLEAWMLKHPDRAAQAQAIFARLAGYTEKLEIRSTAGSLDALSDAELEREVGRRFGLEPEQLRALAAKPVARLATGAPTLTPEGEWASGGPAT